MDPLEKFINNDLINNDLITKSIYILDHSLLEPLYKLYFYTRVVYVPVDLSMDSEWIVARAHAVIMANRHFRDTFGILHTFLKRGDETLEGFVTALLWNRYSELEWDRSVHPTDPPRLSEAGLKYFGSVSRYIEFVRHKDDFMESTEKTLGGMFDSLGIQKRGFTAMFRGPSPRDLTTTESGKSIVDEFVDDEDREEVNIPDDPNRDHEDI